MYKSIYKKYQSGDAAAGETAEVVLCRGTQVRRLKNIVSFKTAVAVLRGGDVEVLPVSAEIAKEFEVEESYPEYTTDLALPTSGSAGSIILLSLGKSQISYTR